MSAVAVTATKVSVPFAHARLRNAIGGVAINGGQAVYFDTGGLAQLANSSTATLGQFAGIAIPRMNSGYACGAGQACEILEWGEVEGFSLSGVAYGALIYLQDDGSFGTTAGTHTVVIGKVVPTSDPDSSGNPRKLLMVFASPNTLVS
jgi:hypothetical protein